MDTFDGDILERISDAFVALDANWRYVYVNRRAGELFGRDPQTLIGRHIWTEFPEGMGQPFHLAYERAMREQEPVTLEDFYAPWGRWFENRIYPSPEGVSIFFTEITERVEAREALRRQALLFQTIPDAVIITDAEGRITGWNPAAEQIFGYGAAEVLGRTPAILHTAEDAPVLTSDIIRAVREHGEWTGEIRTVRKDGSTRTVETTVRPLVDAAGGLVGSIGISRDVTDQRLAEHARRESDARYRALVEASPVAIGVVARGVLTYANPAAVRLFGARDPEEVIGRTVLDFVHPDDRPWVQDRVERMMAGERLPPSIQRWSRLDGTEIVVEAVSTPTEVDGRPAHQTLAWDVTRQVRAEEEMRAARERLELFLNTIPDHVWLKDREGRYLLVNEAHAAAHGIAREEVIGMTDFDLLPAEFAQRFRAADEQVMRTGERSAFENPYPGPDGSQHWFEVIKAPYRDADGAVVGTVGISRDITWRKRVELALRESEERFRQIAHNVREVFWLVEIVDDGVRLVYVNPAYEAIFGRSVDSLYADAASGLTELSPDDRRRQDRAMQEAVAGQEAISEYLLPHPLRGPRWIRTRYFPVRDEQGRVYRVAGLSEDVTERREAEAHYRRLVETAPYGIFATDLQGQINEANAALGEITARSPDELIGRHFSHFIAAEDVGRIEQRLAARREGETGPRDMEFRIVRPDGSRRLLHVRSADVRINGIPAGTHGIVRDITEERERELHLRRVERLASVGTLIGGVAHELNNPLAAIRAFAELMLMDPRSDDDREALDAMRREADRAAQIVSNLRQLARDTQQAEQSRREPVDVNDVVRHVLRVRRYPLQTHNIRVVEELAAALPAVVADRGELEQVVLNLIVNAEQALAGAEGERLLTLRTRASDRGVALTVADSGHGILVEHLGRVFDPFFTTKPPGEGMGLGLSLVHSIVTEHGGEVHVESGPGVGTSFRVDLPATSDPVSGAPGETSAAAPRPLRVLVVDDEESVRLSLSRFLSRRGHQVTVAREGEEALRVLRESAAGFDVLLTDLRMPGLAGDALLARLHNERDLFSGRLIVMTGESVARPAPRVPELGEIPVLYKPFSLDQVARAVEADGE